MSNPRGHRTGLLPSASTQVAIDMSLADIARRIAQAQARKGVHPALAAQHGVAGANALLAWIFFVAPVMGIFTLGAMSSFIGMLTVVPLNALGLLILGRIVAKNNGRADQRLVYRVPTWVLVLAGGGYVMGLFLLMIVNYMRF